MNGACIWIRLECRRTTPAARTIWQRNRPAARFLRRTGLPSERTAALDGRHTGWGRRSERGGTQSSCPLGEGRPRRGTSEPGTLLPERGHLGEDSAPRKRFSRQSRQRNGFPRLVTVFPAQGAPVRALRRRSNRFSGGRHGQKRSGRSNAEACGICGPYRAIRPRRHPKLAQVSLPLDDLNRGNYVDLLEADKYYTLVPSRPVRRHRINDNLLGGGRLRRVGQPRGQGRRRAGLPG